MKKRIRGFEPVYEKGIFILPTRNDEGSAGYDFYSPVDVVIPKGEKVTIWTNIKSYMAKDEVLLLYVRSSIGIKKGLRLANQVGVIDSTYYNNPSNGGDIGICLYNGSDGDVAILKGDRIAQGVFQKYLVADNDLVINKERLGGIGHSGR